MTTRRNFIKQAIAAGVAGSIPYHLIAQEKTVQTFVDRKELIRRSYGAVIPLNIPFLKDERIDYDSLKAYVQYLVNNEARTILLTYGSSEYGLLCDDEIYEITRFVAETVAGRCNFVGASKCWPVDKTVDYIQFAQKCGATGVKVQADIFVTQTNEDSLFEYYRRICQKTDFPLWAYTSSTKVLPDTIAKIAHELPNVYAVKTDGEMMYQYYDMIHKAPELLICSGGQMKTMLLGYRMGSKAYLCPIAPFLPKVSNRFMSLLNSGDYDAAYGMVQAYETPLIQLANTVPWLALIKSVLHVRGHFKTPTVRCPGITVNENVTGEIAGVINKLVEKAKNDGLA